jgi:uncharacterized protein
VRIPTDDEIRDLHARLAPDPATFETVHTHCRIVCAIAEDLLAARHHDVDVALVRAGCLLHDIGVHRLDGPYLRHGVVGHRLLRESGYPEVLARFCSHHTGVGITADEIVRRDLPLPPGDYLAETPEERLVMYADKFHTKSDPPTFLTAATYAAGVRRFGAGKAAAFDELVRVYGEPDLTALSRAYGHPVR